MRAYVTTDEAKAWDPSLSAVTQRQIEQASLMVDELLVGTSYYHDADGYPVDPRQLQTIKDATCAQLADTLYVQSQASGQAAGTVSSASIGSAHYTIDTTNFRAATRRVDSSGVSLEAQRILRQGGFFQSLWTVG